MKNSKVYQISSALILHYNSLCVGLILMWPSSCLLLFKSADTPLNRPMTNEEVNWIATLSSVGALVLTPITGFTLDKLGRKGTIVSVITISNIFWSIVIFSNRVEVILFAVALSGVCGSNYLVVPVFVSEFSEESIRGTLTSGAVVFTGLGMFFAYVLSATVSYKTGLYVAITMTSLGALMLLSLKESPTLLMHKGMYEEARNSMAFYRNSPRGSQFVSQELEKVRRTLTPNGNELLSDEEIAFNSKARVKLVPKKSSIWQVFKQSKASQRALTVVLILMFLCMSQGMLVVQTYSKLLFHETVPEDVLPADWCSALLSLVSVIMGFFAAYMTDFAGRRIMVMVSSVLVAVCCTLIGSQIQFSWGPQWVAPLFVYLYCACYTLGAGIVPFLLSAEVFLPEIRSIISMLTVEWYVACLFMVTSTFGPVINALGLGPSFYIFSGFGILSAVFAFFFLPETKGLTVDVIQQLFYKPKTTGSD